MEEDGALGIWLLHTGCVHVQNPRLIGQQYGVAYGPSRFERELALTWYEHEQRCNKQNRHRDHMKVRDRSLRDTLMHPRHKEPEQRGLFSGSMTKIIGRDVIVV